jgi:hypothetical protein
MILKSIKTTAETGIEGIEFVMIDKQISEVIVGKLHIRKGESYGKALEVLVESPFEVAERYRLTASIKDFPDAVSYHESKYDAEGKGATFNDIGAMIVIDRVDVLIDQGGNVSGIHDAKKADDSAGVPF